jgi:penicillin-binding protein 1C
VHFIPEIETPRNEWFVSGTEADVVRLVGNVKQGAAQYAKILYPTNGTVIAIDPDIPTNHQRVQFSYKGGIDVTWMLDGANVGSEKDGWWQPTSGNHELVMKDLSGNELDSVVFDVRGSALP